MPTSIIKLIFTINMIAVLRLVWEAGVSWVGRLVSGGCCCKKRNRYIIATTIANSISISISTNINKLESLSNKQWVVPTFPDILVVIIMTKKILETMMMNDQMIIKGSGSQEGVERSRGLFPVIRDTAEKPRDHFCSFNHHHHHHLHQHHYNL